MTRTTEDRESRTLHRREAPRFARFARALCVGLLAAGAGCAVDVDAVDAGTQDTSSCTCCWNQLVGDECIATRCPSGYDASYVGDGGVICMGATEVGGDRVSEALPVPPGGWCPYRMGSTEFSQRCGVSGPLAPPELPV